MNEEIIKRLRMISSHLKQEYKAERVILFGSYAKGKPTEDSDIDLLVISETNEGFYKRMASVRGIIRDLRNGLPIAPIVLTSQEIEGRLEMGDQFIKEIIEEGIPL